MNDVIVKLDDNDTALVALLAHARNDGKESHGVRSKKIVADRSEYDTHALGIGAEVAVAKFYGVFPCCVAGLAGDGDIFDLSVGGYSIEVKCRRERGYDFALMTTDPGEFRADVGVLVYLVGEWEYEIRGVISRKKFCSVAHERDYGHGPRLIADAKHFSHPSALTGRRKPELV